MRDKLDFQDKFTRAFNKRTMHAYVQDVIITPEFIPVLIEMSISAEEKAAGRASWTLESLQLQSPYSFFPFIPDFLKHYPQQSRDTCKRHFTNILCRLTEAGQIIGKQDTGPLIEASFRWLSDPASPVAVLVNCWSVLCLLRREQEWISHELALLIEHRLQNPSPAIRARGKKILSLLYKDK